MSYKPGKLKRFLKCDKEGSIDKRRVFPDSQSAYDPSFRPHKNLSVVELENRIKDLEERIRLLEVKSSLRR